MSKNASLVNYLTAIPHTTPNATDKENTRLHPKGRSMPSNYTDQCAGNQQNQATRATLPFPKDSDHC